MFQQGTVGETMYLFHMYSMSQICQWNKLLLTANASNDSFFHVCLLAKDYKINQHWSRDHHSVKDFSIDLSSGWVLFVYPYCSERQINSPHLKLCPLMILIKFVFCFFFYKKEASQLHYILVVHILLLLCCEHCLTFTYNSLWLPLRSTKMGVWVCHGLTSC